LFNVWESFPVWKRNVIALVTILLACIFGFQALLVPCFFFAIASNVVLDAEAQRFFKQVKADYFVELNDDPEVGETVVDVKSSRAPIKFAVLAQSKVGILSPTVANRLVYETVLLRIFEEQRVRHNIRLELLGEALLACFVRPESYEIALRVIESLNCSDTIK